MNKAKHPIQPIVFDDYGVARFKSNPIVEWLLESGPFDLNQIAILPGITDEDHEQFAQLIGYSVSGAGDLSYFSDDTWNKAYEMQQTTKEEEK